MKQNTLYEVVFYILIPMIIWNEGRDFLGDYYAMLFSSLPGILYTVINFIKDRQFNITGIFFLVNLIIGATLDILVNSAEKILWNAVYLNFAMFLFWLLTMLIHKPMVKYFFVDYAYLNGFPREQSHQLYAHKEISPFFYFLTLAFALKDLVMGGLRLSLIHLYGVEGFDRILIITRVVTWLLNGLVILGIIFVITKINDFVKIDDANAIKVENDMKI